MAGDPSLSNVNGSNSPSNVSNPKPKIPLAMYLYIALIGRSDKIKDLIDDKAKEMKENNAKMSDNRTAMSELRALKSQQGSDVKFSPPTERKDMNEYSTSVSENPLLSEYIKKCKPASPVNENLNRWLEANPDIKEKYFAKTTESVYEKINENKYFCYKQETYSFKAGASWEQLMQDIENKNATLASTSQTDMIEFQKLTNNYNQTFDMLTNMMSNLKGANDKIINDL